MKNNKNTFVNCEPFIIVLRMRWFIVAFKFIIKLYKTLSGTRCANNDTSFTIFVSRPFFSFFICTTRLHRAVVIPTLVCVQYVTKYSAKLNWITESVTQSPSCLILWSRTCMVRVPIYEYNLLDSIRRCQRDWRSGNWTL